MRAASMSATAVTPSPVQATGTPTDHRSVEPRQPTTPVSSPNRSTSEWQLRASASSRSSARRAGSRNRWTRRERSRSGRAAVRRRRGRRAGGRRPIAAGRMPGRIRGTRDRVGVDRHELDAERGRGVPARGRRCVSRDRAAQQAEPGAPQAPPRPRRPRPPEPRRSRRRRRSRPSDSGGPHDRGCSRA